MTWLKRVRGALGMGLIWAVGWAVIGGGIMEAVVDPRGEILDMWPQTLAIPGFIVGVVFSALLALGDGRRRFEDLSLARFAGWGAAAGAALGVTALGLGIFPGISSMLLRAAVVLGPLTVLSAASASGTYALGRYAERRAQLASGARGGARDVELAEGGEQGKLGA